MYYSLTIPAVLFVFRMGKKVKKEVEPPPKDVVSL